MNPSSRRFEALRLVLAAHYGVDTPLLELPTVVMRPRPRTLSLRRLLPYPTEHLHDSNLFLAHILAHLYISILTLDLTGRLPVSARDMAVLRANAGVDVIEAARAAMPTNMVQDGSCQVAIAEDEPASSDEASSDEENEDDGGEIGDEEDAGFEEDDCEGAIQHKLGTDASTAGVRTWTRELLVWLKAKHDIPVTLRVSLAKVYFALCMSRGQYISIKNYVKAFEVLTKDAPFLREYGLVLPWQDLGRELEQHISTTAVTRTPLEVKDQKQLMRLVTRASLFFKPEESPAIFQTFASRIGSVNATAIISVLAMMPLAFTSDQSNPHDCRYYIAPLYYIWAKQNASSSIGAQVSSRLGSIAMAALSHISDHPGAHEYMNLGHYGVFEENQVKFLVNSLINSLSIMREKYSTTSSRFFHGYAATLVYSISDLEGIMDLLWSLMNALESYIHPSNSGEWLNPISKWVRSLVYQYHKRFTLETQKYGVLYNLPESSKLASSTTDQFVANLLPFTRIGIQSKDTVVRLDYTTSLKLLAYMRPQAVLELVLLDLYESLEGVISTHRVSVALRSFEVLARYFAITPVFRVHLARLMLSTVPGIDSNDLTKTVLALHVLASIAVFVPLHDISDGNGDCTLAMNFTQAHIDYLTARTYFPDETPPHFEYSPEDELAALKSSSCAFKTIIKTFELRLFLLLENLTDPSNSDGLEKSLAGLLAKFVHVILESLSDDIFATFRNDFFEFVLNNTLHDSVADVVAETCGCLIKRDPSKFGEYCVIIIDRIREEVSANGAGKSRTGTEIVPRDQCLIWYLYILNKCTGNAGSAVLHYASQLLDICLFLLDTVRGPAMFSSSDLVNQILKTVTEIRLNENRVISPAYIEKFGVDEKCWGGFQFDPKRFEPENTQFSWFVPEREHVVFAIDFFHEVVTRAMRNINVFMSNDNTGSPEGLNSLAVIDGIRVNLLYMGDALAGVSYLLDPSFEQHQAQSDKITSARLQLEDDMPGLLSHDLGKFQDNWDTIISEVTQNGEAVSEFAGAEMAIDVEGDAHNLSDSTRVHDDPLSTEQNTRRGSPSLDADEISLTSPELTSRDERLYTSAYFFGDDLNERHQDPLYTRLHATRQSVGRSLHLIFKFLTRHFHENTRVMRHVFYAIKIWLLNSGKERVLQSSPAKIHYLYVSSMMLINRVKKPMTRIAIGARAEAYHAFRVEMHASARPQSRIDKLLVQDVVKMCFSAYAELSLRAQQIFPEVFKRINGLLSAVVTESLNALQEGLDNNDPNAIENGLEIFDSSKVQGRLVADVESLVRFLDLLYRCLEVSEGDVLAQAQELFATYIAAIEIPSAVCILDKSAIDLIRPPGATVDTEIADLRICKQQKLRNVCQNIGALQEYALGKMANVHHWKARLLTIKLLIGLQTEFETPVSTDVLAVLVREAADEHPSISRQLLEGITRIISKCVALRNYDYRMENFYDLSFITRDSITVQTQKKDGSSYTNDWRIQRNSKLPKYFMDATASCGWLFWDEKMTAANPHLVYDIPFSQTHADALTTLGKYVSKEWLKSIVELWISEGEGNLALQLFDVMFITALVILVSSKLCENLCFQDILDVLVEVFDREDKMSHLAASEIIFGILLASRFMDPALIEARDDAICSFLRQLLENDLSPDNKHVWNIFVWFVTGQVDWLRFPRILACFTDFEIDGESDYALREATRLSYLRSMVAASTCNTLHREKLNRLCIDNYFHRYEDVRLQVGALQALLLFAYDGEWVASGSEFVERTQSKRDLTLYRKDVEFFNVWKEMYTQVARLRDLIRGLLPQDALKSNYMRACTTFLLFLRSILGTSIGTLFGPYVRSILVPFLLELVSLKEVCQLGNIDPASVFKLVSQISFMAKDCEDIVAMLEFYAQQDLNMLQVVILGEFTETFYFKNSFSMTTEQRLRIIALTNQLVFHSNAEIRVLEALTLAGLVHISPPREVALLVPQYTESYVRQIDSVRRRYRKTGLKNLDSKSLAQMHGATLALGAFIHAFAFSSPPPPWIPPLLAGLASKCSGVPGLVGKTAKEVLGKFKKNRQDLWHVDSKFFSTEQMQDLEGVLWKSYII